MSLFVASLPAFAALGEDAKSILDDQAHMQGTLKVTPAQLYTVHEIQSANGVKVREYLSPSGSVFGVAWNGPLLPDLRQLLATHFDEFSQAQKEQANNHTGRRPLAIRHAGLVVLSGGHMRSFAGHAYIPAEVPAGVSPEEIR